MFRHISLKLSPQFFKAKVGYSEYQDTKNKSHLSTSEATIDSLPQVASKSPSYVTTSCRKNFSHLIALDGRYLAPDFRFLS